MFVVGVCDDASEFDEAEIAFAELID